MHALAHRSAATAAHAFSGIRRVAQLHAAATSSCCHLGSHTAVSQPKHGQAARLAPPPAAVTRGARHYAFTRMVVACVGAEETVELEVKVEGMKCGGCSSRVEAALKAMDHVKGVQVDLETKLATVEVQAPSLIDAMNMLPGFVKTIKDLGFEAEPHIEYQG